jgi:hypothetical protein
MNKRLARVLAKRARSHIVSHENDRVVVREPEIHDGGIACTLHGDPSHPATLEQAFAIAAALDRLAKRVQARED